MPKKNATKSTEKPTSKIEVKPAAKTVAVPSLKPLIKAICNGEKPRGLKITANDAGALTLSFGAKSAPIAVVASKDEVLAALFGFLGLKLSA